jgi:hypothetical protein
MFYFTVWPLPIVDDHFFIKIFIYFKICSKIYFILIKNYYCYYYLRNCSKDLECGDNMQSVSIFFCWDAVE